MVGYAYSADSSSDYEYILIKAYNCEDFSFVNSSIPYCLYKFSRIDRSVIPANSEARHNSILSYKNLCIIADKLSDEEFKNMYPCIIAWQITISGICNVKSSADMEAVWPLSPMQLRFENPYVDISQLCTNHLFSKLEASFAVSVLNEAVYLCGIYMSDLFTLSGDRIFCSYEFAGIVNSVFGYNGLMSEFSRFEKQKSKMHTISASKLAKNIGSIRFENPTHTYNYNTILAYIKAECVHSLINYIGKCIGASRTFARLVRGVRCIIAKSFKEVKSFSAELMARGNLKMSTDINYLSFSELMEAFTFADSMRDIQKTVRKNRERSANIKRLSKPVYIYKGKIIYKRCNNEN